MAPTQQHCNDSSLLNVNIEKSNEMKASSNVQIETKSSASSSVSNLSRSSISDNSSRTSLEGTTYAMDWPSGNIQTFLPIATRGLFYNDSFFEEARKDFDHAVKQVLDRWGQRSHDKNVDDLTSYRRMRALDLHDKNQAVSVTQDENNHKVVVDVRDFLEGDIKVKVLDENELVVEGSFDRKDNCSVSRKNFQRRFTFPSLVKSDAVTSAMSSDGVLTITVPKNNQMETKMIINDLSKDSETKTSSKCKEKTMERKQDNQEMTTSFLQNASCDITQDSLPVADKGLFFQDSFFKSARQDFEKSVNEILKKFGEKRSMNSENTMASYRDLRSKDLKEENQAVSVSESEDHHKVILDVTDFMDGDLKVKIVDENELRVEGKLEKKNEGVFSNKRFCKSFTFPGLIKANSITSAMSSDGILTVTIPKEVQSSSQQILTDTTTNNSLSNSSLFDSDVAKISSSRNHHNSIFSEPLLTIKEKGSFFHDDFFTSVRQDFENAVKEVLTNFGVNTSFSDNISTYRNMRSKDLKDENQAVTTSEDHQSHKVVIDVHDFMNDDLKVRIVDDSELVIEGKVEKNEEGSTSTKVFKRSFVFPGLVHSNAVSSTLSNDGVLIVTVPKNMQETNKLLANLPGCKSNSNVQVNQVSRESLESNSTKNSTFQNETKMQSLMMNSNTTSHMNSNMETFEKAFADCSHNFENEAKKFLSHFDESETDKISQSLEPALDSCITGEDKRTSMQENSSQEMKMASSYSTNSFSRLSTSKQVLNN